jgi:F-type H+-transporting ATPase subunit delta
LIRQSIARRYAKGLFAVGEKNGRYREYLGQLNELLLTITKEAKVKKAIMLPLLEMDKRKELLSYIVKALSTEPTLTTLLNLLLEKNRMEYLPLIAKAYEEMVDDKEGKVKGTVYTPYFLSDELKLRIEEALREKIGKKVLLNIQEDTSLIGGIKVIVGGTHIDGSIKRQLELLNESMMKE